MASAQRRYIKEECARRGDALYESTVRPHLKAKDRGKYIAIDIETGVFEMDTDALGACDRLRLRVTDPQIWLMRAGSHYLHYFGGRAPQGQRC